LEFRGAIKQRVPARKFGCQRLQRLEKKKEKNEEVAKRRDKRRLRADSPRHKESPAAHKVTLDFISQMPNDVHPSSVFFRSANELAWYSILSSVNPINTKDCIQLFYF